MIRILFILKHLCYLVITQIDVFRVLVFTFGKSWNGVTVSHQTPAIATCCGDIHQRIEKQRNLLEILFGDSVQFFFQY